MAVLEETFVIKVVSIDTIKTLYEAEYTELAYQALIVEIEQKIIMTRVRKNRIMNEEFKNRPAPVAKSYRQRILEAAQNLLSVIIGGK